MVNCRQFIALLLLICCCDVGLPVCGLAVTNTCVCLMSNFVHCLYSWQFAFVVLYRLFALVHHALLHGVVHYCIGVRVVNCTFIERFAFVHGKQNWCHQATTGMIRAKFIALKRSQVIIELGADVIFI